MHSILVVELTRLGDVLCMIPALARLRSAFPKAKITCVVQKPYAELVESLNLDLTAVGLAATRTIGGFLPALRAVRRIHADIACSMSPAKRNALLTVSCGALVKAGYLKFLNAQVQYLHRSPVSVWGQKAAAKASYGREHLSMRAMKVCDALGLPGSSASSPPAIRNSILSDAYQRIAPFLASVRVPYVVLHPFAAWEYKQWPIQQFLQLAESIIAEFNEDVVVVCEEGEQIRWQAGSTGTRQAGRIHLFTSRSLVETAAMLRGASVMVGNDSGPLHLAGLVGAPVVGLYGPATPDLTAPRGAQGVFLYHPVACSPCQQVTCVHPENPCMNAISVEEVMAAIRFLNKVRTSNPASAYA